MKKVLIVVDMQNDFIDGALGTKEAQAIVPAVIAKIREYKGETVFATRDTHYENYLETAEGEHLPIEHCIKHTEGWKIQTEVEKALNEVGAEVIDKPTFGSTVLAKKVFELAKTNYLEIEMIGLCTDICVVSNALLLKANLPEAVIKVDPKCCAGVTPESHEAALLTMKMCQID